MPFSLCSLSPMSESRDSLVSTPIWLATLFANALSLPHEHHDAQRKEEDDQSRKDAERGAETDLSQHGWHEKGRRV